MAAHSTFAKGRGAAENDIEAVRNGNLPNDPRLAALIRFAREAARQGGAVSAEDLRRFSDAGFSQAQALEVLIGVIQVTLASLVYSMSQAPVDEGFKAFDWSPAAA
jgi:alkylhydroperoxidase family enzyme